MVTSSLWCQVNTRVRGGEERQSCEEEVQGTKRMDRDDEKGEGMMRRDENEDETSDEEERSLLKSQEAVFIGPCHFVYE